MSTTIPLPLMPPSTSSHHLLRRFFFRPTTLPTFATTVSASKQLHPLNNLPFHYPTKFSYHHKLLYSKTQFSPLHALNDAVLTNNSDYEAENEDNVLDTQNDVVLDDQSNSFNSHVAAFEDKATYSKSLNDVVLENKASVEDEVVLEDEIDDFSYNASVGDKVVETLNDVVLEEETGGLKDGVDDKGRDSLRRKVLGVNAKGGPSLSIKEKKELASYAHGLGKMLRSQQVGKSGVTDTVITALIETLEKRELLKLKIHGNCPVELDDAIIQIEMGTGSVAISQIGRTVILYRPSVSKLQAEQKKKLAQRNLMKKRPAWVRSSSQSKEELPKLTARGRRGSSRV